MCEGGPGRGGVTIVYSRTLWCCAEWKTKQKVADLLWWCMVVNICKELLTEPTIRKMAKGIFSPRWYPEQWAWPWKSFKEALNQGVAVARQHSQFFKIFSAQQNSADHHCKIHKPLTNHCRKKITQVWKNVSVLLSLVNLPQLASRDRKETKITGVAFLLWWWWWW